MSRIIAARPAHAAPRSRPALTRRPLSRVRRIGYAVLALQLGCFLAWSTLLYQRFALTLDFAIYHQAWFLIAHGNLDPYSSLKVMTFWRSNCEFYPWLLACLYWIWPHGVVLLWVQDAGVVAAEWVAFTWLCELAGRHRPGRDAAWLAGAGLVLLAANPWIWWSVSFDFHEEGLAIAFVALLAWDLAHGRRRVWAWVLPVLAAGAPAATYVAGLGLGGVLAGRRSRVPGAILAVIGVGYSLLVVFIHGDLGSTLAHHYGYLVGTASGYASSKLTFGGLAKGIASHPLNVLQTLWSRRTDIVANLAPAGLLGVGFSLLSPILLLALLTDILSSGLVYAQPTFQALPIYVLLPVGTVAVLAWLSRRRPRMAILLAGLAAAQTLGWAAVWGPRTASQWLRVPAASAATLTGIAAEIPASAEVIASQGVVGRFSGRPEVNELVHPGRMPVSGGDTWFIIAPSMGIDVQRTASEMGLIAELAGPMHATLITHANGIWAFRWRPPAGIHAMRVPGNLGPLPAWAAPLASGTAGRPVLSGPVRTWHLTSTGAPGYVADGLAWQVPTGQYQVNVTLSARLPVNVEVWNDNGNRMLARRSIPATNGIETVALPVDATTAYQASPYSGWGPFRVKFVPPPPGQRVEVRIWSPGGGTVNVYRAGLTGPALTPQAPAA